MGMNQSRRSEQLEMSLQLEDSVASAFSNVCPKNGNHDGFIHPADLSLHHLPKQLQHETVLEWLHLEAERTVKITVTKTSPDRPSCDVWHDYIGKDIPRCATGRAWPHGMLEHPFECPIRDCPHGAPGESHNVYGYLQISTNKHIVFDDFEASNTTIEFFFDSDDHKDKVLTIYGVRVDYDIDQEDTSIIHCVYHEEFLPQFLSTEIIWACLRRIPSWVRENMSRHVFVISHPHGFAKRITVGDVVDRKKPWSERSWFYRTLSNLLQLVVDLPDECVTRYTAKTCRGSSGAPVLVVMNGRFCWPISHCAFDSEKNVGVSHSYFK